METWLAISKRWSVAHAVDWCQARPFFDRILSSRPIPSGKARGKLAGCHSAVMVAASVLVCLAGCTPPPPVSMEQRQTQALADLTEMFGDQVNLLGSVTIHQAMARAIQHNLTIRIKNLTNVLEQDSAHITRLQMLPRLAASAGYLEHDKQSTETSDRFESSYDLSVAWSVLDFGITALRARQDTNRLHISEELQRKTAQSILQDVRVVFWRAVVAQKLKNAVGPLKLRVTQALASAREAEKRRLQSPIELLDFQKKLLQSLKYILALEEDLADTHARLAELMNIQPTLAMTCIEPENTLPVDPNHLPESQILEKFALRNRPELYERDYKKRIKIDETRQALLRMLPGLEWNATEKYASGHTYINHHWTTAGMQLSWNLLNLISAPANYKNSKHQEAFEDTERLALSMSILAQVHITREKILQSSEKYHVSLALSQVNERLYRETEASQQAASLSELELIQREVDRILFDTQRDLAYAELQQAFGQMVLAVGIDLVPPNFAKRSFDELTADLATWSRRVPALFPKVTNTSDVQSSNDTELDRPAWEVKGQTDDPALSIPLLDLLDHDPELAAPAWKIFKRDPELATPTWQISNHDSELATPTWAIIQPN